ncbi:hypothetical protein BCR41DRAFT_123586 [Lobosporangium transversale]|uniref:Uncharacterized protein n=1 Tax=Lobosporangium transversale TaxID=64571 RepID=A0A1Y2H1K7_9FUNG|nr:hypothetical protein BCR41DRAFT_123586 [Lobosporangium transversale]ORZ27881.1 hypothetical protein BCR41DRAFT_123586 [Lobosporangium transversale]|eukprot:XP_021885584.1 hypothetical protein BCR41DRAFT_123586 [Lobosporangium transversale]
MKRAQYSCLLLLLLLLYYILFCLLCSHEDKENPLTSFLCFSFLWFILPLFPLTVAFIHSFGYFLFPLPFLPTLNRAQFTELHLRSDAMPSQTSCRLCFFGF